MPRRLAVMIAALLLGSTGLLGNPAPVAAAWERTVSITFFAGGGYGDGKGRVTSDDEAIDCTYDAGIVSGTCSYHYILADFLPDYDMTLTFDPDPGSYVCLSTTNLCQTGGTNQTYPIHFDRGTPGNQTVSPSFNLRVFQVHVDVLGPGSVGGNGAFCPVGGSVDYCGEFKYGTSATLTADPDSGYLFNYWDGDFDRCFLEPTPTCSFTVTGNVNLQAQFGMFLLRLERTGSGTVCVKDVLPLVCQSPNSATFFDHGTSLTVVSTPAAGWRFDHWNAGACAGKPATCTFTLDADTNLKATFVAIATPAPTTKPSTKPGATPTLPASPPAPSQPAPTEASAPSAAPSPPTTSEPSPLTTAGPAASLAPSGDPASSDAVGGTPATSDGATPAEPAATEAGGSLLPALLAIAALGIGTLVLGFLVGRRRREGATPPRA